MLSDEDRIQIAINSIKECIDFSLNFDYEDIKIVLNLIEKQSKEIEELKVAFNNCFDECTSLRENFHKQIEISKNIDKKWEDKIKAKIEEMDNIISQNEGIIFNGRYEHLHTLTEARIVKGEMQSLLEKE